MKPDPTPTPRRRYSEADARHLIEAFLDPGTFREILGPPERVTSPHLEQFNHAVEFDDGVAIGVGTLNGERVFMAAQQGGFDGGSVGEVHAAKLTGLLRRAAVERPAAVIAALDSGGVRLHEANIGIIGISEIIRATLDARAAGVPCIAMAGGRVGVYGGIGIAAACFDYLIMSERGRAGVSGPVVIETALGVEEMDSKDRAQTWRIYGGKTRYLLDDADFFVEDDIAAFRAAAIDLLGAPVPIDADTVFAEQERLERKLELYGDCPTPEAVWKKTGVDIARAALLDAAEFVKARQAAEEGRS